MLEKIECPTSNAGRNIRIPAIYKPHAGERGIFESVPFYYADIQSRQQYEIKLTSHLYYMPILLFVKNDFYHTIFYPCSIVLRHLILVLQ